MQKAEVKEPVVIFYVASASSYVIENNNTHLGNMELQK